MTGMLVRKLIETKLEAEREHKKKLLEANNRVLGTIFRVELAETNKRIDAIAQSTKALRKGHERIEQKLDRSVQNHEERIKIIEEHVELLHKN